MKIRTVIKAETYRKSGVAFSHKQADRTLQAKQLLVLVLALAGLINSIAFAKGSCPATAESVRGDGASPVAAFSDTVEPNQQEQAQIKDAFGNLPLSFEANRGQTDEEVKFMSRGSGYSLFLTSTEAVFKLRDGRSAQTSIEPSTRPVEKRSSRSALLRMKLVGANPSPEAEGLDRLPSNSNYFIGRDPSRWRTDVPNYSRVNFRSVFPGIDVVYYGNQRQLEYDFKVAPGADPRAIKLNFEGARRAQVDADGDLVLQTRIGKVRHRKPVIYQEENGERKQVAGHYVIGERNIVSFAVGSYDKNKPLVIDPILVFSSYLGGSGSDTGCGVSSDSSGNVYITGGTESVDFPTMSPWQMWNYGNSDVFVTKMNAAGTALIYSTYIGGSMYDSARSIAVGAGGNAYITGITESNDFPTYLAYDMYHNGGTDDAFVTRLDSNGSMLVFSTYLGGAEYDWADRIVLTGGTIYLTGTTYSTDFPTTDGVFQPSRGGEIDAFVTKMSIAGNSLIFSSYLGGSQPDQGTGLAVDSSGNIVVTGLTRSADFPTTFAPFDASINGVFDAFVTKVNPTGQSLVFSTYLGGADSDYAFDVAVDGANYIYVTGGTYSTNFPVTPGAFDTTHNGVVDGFVTKFGPNGRVLNYSTYFGGNDLDTGTRIAIDHAAIAYIAGNTGSANFPVTGDAMDKTHNGFFDCFVLKLDAAGQVVLHSTYLGGSGTDQVRDMALRDRDMYITGSTSSTNFKTTVGAFDRTLNGTQDAFVTKFDF